MSERYKYSENPTEVTEVYIDTITHGEYMGMEQGGSMKRVPLPLLAGEITEAVEGRLDVLEGADSVEGSVAKDIKDAVDPMKGTGWVDENLVDHEERLDTLEGDVSTEGSVLKAVKDNAEDATFTPIGGIEATTIKGAIAELDTKKEPADATILKEADIVNDLTTGGVDKPLSAEQGKTLGGWVDQSVKVGAVPSFNGLKFPATQVPSSDPNTLDDYEEGTWTPTFVGASGSGDGAIIATSGTYVKIGNKVTAWANYTFTSIGAWTGFARFAGYPFLPASADSFSSSTIFADKLIMPSGTVYITTGLYIATRAFYYIYAVRDSVVPGACGVSAFATNGCTLKICIEYTV